MSTPKCAPSEILGRPTSSYFFLTFLLILTIFLFCKSAQAEQPLILPVLLNQQSQGDYFVIMKDDGDFLMSVEDLKKMGLKKVQGEKSVSDGTEMVSLQSMTAIDFRFDQETLSLILTSNPELLPGSVIDLSPSRHAQVFYPRDNSFFLNYGLEYTSGGGSFDYEDYSLANELGWRFDKFLLTSESLYQEASGRADFIRLNSRLIQDNREQLRRTIAGDFFAFSGGLGTRVQMGGFSFSKNYGIDPYFIEYPLFDYSGLLPLPSKVDIFVDGQRVKTEDLSPGPFSLQNFQSLGGAQSVEVVVRDIFGRETHITQPYYFTDRILRRGLHEYSYNIGFLREDFGQKSNSYGSLAFSGFHRYGFTDELNLSLRGEATDSFGNLGFETLLRLNHYGLISVEVAASQGDKDTGAAGSLEYNFQTRRFHSRLGLQVFTETYRTLDELPEESRKKLNFFAGAGFVLPRIGSFNVNYSRSETFGTDQQEVLFFSWARRAWRKAYLRATFRQRKTTETIHEGELSLTWYFGRDYSAVVDVGHRDGADFQAVEARKTVPVGTGTGWHVRGEHSKKGGENDYLLDSFVQHNAQHASFTGEFTLGQSEEFRNEDLRLSLAGALVFLGGELALTRPVNDSFGLVRVGSVEGVRVYRDNQLVGTTDHKGKAFIPEMTSFYDNLVIIEDEDIPLDYLMPQVELYVSPSLRGGACLNFPLKRYQAFTGTLHTKANGTTQPLTNAELVLQSPSGPVKFWTGGEGEFYLDSQMDELDILSVQGCEAAQEDSTSFLPAGTYPIRVKYEGQSFDTEITIPESEEIFTELGTVTLPVLSGTVPAVDSPASPEKAENAAQPEQPDRGPDQQTQPGPPPTPKTDPNDQLGDERKISATPGEDTTTNIRQKESGDIQQKPPFTIHFPLDSSTPLPSAEPILAQTLQYLEENPDLPIEIEGHGSREGSEPYNQRLGYLRAEAFKDYLLHAGIKEQRIHRIVSYGEQRPLCEEWTEDCLRRNRRAVLLVVIPPEN